MRCANEFCPLATDCKTYLEGDWPVEEVEPVKENDRICECDHFVDGQEDEE
jgi:hypothetical protein